MIDGATVILSTFMKLNMTVKNTTSCLFHHTTLEIGGVSLIIGSPTSSFLDFGVYFMDSITVQENTISWAWIPVERQEIFNTKTNITNLFKGNELISLISVKLFVPGKTVDDGDLEFSITK